jgi:hypothetical protein
VSDYPPDDVTVSVGTWNTDVELDTTVFIAGDASVKFLATTPATNPSIVKKEVPASPGDIFITDSILRASSNSAGNTIGVAVEWLDSAKGVLSQDWAPGTGLVTAVDTWYRYQAQGTAPSDTCFARARFDKTKTAFTANVGLLGMRKVKPSFKAALNADTDYADGETVICGREIFDYGSIYDTGTGKATIVSPGTYMFTAQLSWNAAKKLDAGEYVQPLLSINGTSYAYGPRMYAPTNNSPMAGQVIYIGTFSTGEYCLPLFTTDHLDDSGDLTLVGHATSDFTNFAGYKLD